MQTYYFLFCYVLTFCVFLILFCDNNDDDDDRVYDRDDDHDDDDYMLPLRTFGSGNAFAPFGRSFLSASISAWQLQPGRINPSDDAYR